MKTIRWLLSHFFLILLIVTVIYCYMFWGNLIGKETPAGKAVAYLSHEFVAVENFVNAVKQQQAKLSDRKLVDKKSKVEKVPVLADSETSSNKILSGTVIDQNIRQNPVSISHSHNQMQIKQNAAGELEVIEAKPLQNIAAVSENTSVKVVNEKPSLFDQPLASRVYNAASLNNGEEKRMPDSFVPAEIKKQLDNVDKNGKVLDQAEQNANTRTLWITARKAYYQRNYLLSEKSYQQVIDNTEDNYDAYGELGNVYFNQGKEKQAAAAYYEAAAILVRRGQIPRARSLTGLLHHLDEPKAIQLQQLIGSAAS